MFKYRDFVRISYYILFVNYYLSVNLSFLLFWSKLYGSALKFQFQLLRRLELRCDINLLKKRFIDINYNFFFSNLLLIHSFFIRKKSILKLVTFYLLRLSFIKFYRGRVQIIGKPAHGQRTRSNANTSKRVNKILRKELHLFIKKKEVVSKKKKQKTIVKKKKKIKKI